MSAHKSKLKSDDTVQLTYPSVHEDTVRHTYVHKVWVPNTIRARRPIRAQRLGSTHHPCTKTGFDISIRTRKLDSTYPSRARIGSTYSFVHEDSVRHIHPYTKTQFDIHIRTRRQSSTYSSVHED